MGVDVFTGKKSGADFARGEPPPANSFEWSFLPQSAADAMAKGRKPERKPEARASVKVAGEEGEKKPRPWLWGIAGFVAGLIACTFGHKES